jgi:hypothetical protein
MEIRNTIIRIREGSSIAYYNSKTHPKPTDECDYGVIKKIDRKNKIAIMEDGTEVNINSPNITIADD